MQQPTLDEKQIYWNVARAISQDYLVTREYILQISIALQYLSLEVGPFPLEN